MTPPTNETDDDFGDDDYDPGITWFCNHDVPNGCSPCRADRNINAALDAMTDEERADYLYDGGTFETFFAPGGPAYQQGL